jgi:hypothetical protein
MFNDAVLGNFFENCTGKLLGTYKVRHSAFRLFYKQSAYNWIAVSDRPAPSFGPSGRLIPQTQVKAVMLASEDVQKFAVIYLSGRVFFSRWLTYGDEFHVTLDDLMSSKIGFDSLSDSDKRILNKLSAQFIHELDDTIQYKLNAGKRVGLSLIHI